ncbi:MAG: heavy metal translocating P-type ATPase [Chloroflexota bacterium]
MIQSLIKKFIPSRTQIGHKKSLADSLNPDSMSAKLSQREAKSWLSQLKDVWQAKDEHEADINFKILLSAGSMLFAGIGQLGYPLFILLSVPVILYLCIPMIQGGYRQVWHHRRVGAATLDGAAAITLLVLGYFFEFTLYFLIYYASRKVLYRTEDHTRKSLVNILGEIPKAVWVEKEGMEVEVVFDSLQLGDLVVINAGEPIMVDGVVAKGIGNVDQHILTGEAQMAEKGVGDSVFASSTLLSGRLYIRIEKLGTETVAANIKHILDNTTDYKSSFQAYGERMADYAALPVLLGGLITLPLLGARSAATILIASFGSQIRVIAPLSMLKFLKIASKHHILIKDGRSLESLCAVDTFVFDKTGTLTEEQPHVNQIYACNGYEKREILYYAAAAEYKQKHPIALAILQEAANQHMDLPQIDEANYDVGYGLRVQLDDKVIRVGSRRFMDIEGVAIPPSIQTVQLDSQTRGASFVYVAVDKQLGGMIELQATIRSEAKEVLQQLHERNMNTVIISGDHTVPTQQLAQELGIKQYFAEVLPERKASLVAELQQQGRSVCFVGDGINDSIALKKANVSISLQGASTIATDTAQIVLMDESLQNLPLLLDLAHSLESNLNKGLFTALAPGITTVLGVYLFQIGILASTLLYYISLTLGVKNALHPKLKNNQTDSGSIIRF